MADSTPPLPPVPRSGDSPAPLGRDEQSLKIIAASENLQVIRRPTRIEGEVVKISPDGKTAIIQTAQGRLEVVMRERAPLQPGQKVEIDLPPGHPPRQLVVRPAPEPPPHTQTQKPLPLQAGQIPPHEGDLPAAPEGTPRPPIQTTPQTRLPPQSHETIDLLNPPRVTPSSPIPLKLEAIIRLIPLPVLPQPEMLLPSPLPLPSAVSLPALQIEVFKAVTIAEDAQIAAPHEIKQQSLAPDPSLPEAIELSFSFIKPAAEPASFLTSLMKIPDTMALLSPASRNESLPNVKIDFAPLQIFALKLPVMKQIRPFIIPVTAQAIEPPEQKFDLRLVAIEPENPLASPVPSGKEIVIPENTLAKNSPVTLSASVIATTLENFPVLSMLWPGQDAPDSFALQFPASNLPVGTRVELLPPGPQPALAPLITGSFTPAPVLLSGWTWPALEEAVDILAPAPTGAHAATVQNFVNVLPNPASPAQIPPAILFFMAAIGAGDLSGWLGDKAANTLRREGIKGADIIQRLSRDFAGLSRMTDEPVSQEWRGMAIPMLFQGEVTKINLFYRHQDEKKKDKDDQQGDRGTRFLFDLELTRIGALQLDGYMKAKRLDLIVRSKTPFSQAMQSEMRRRYLDVLNKGSLTGELGFQNRSDHWVTVDARQAELQTSA